MLYKQPLQYGIVCMSLRFECGQAGTSARLLHLPACAVTVTCIVMLQQARQPWLAQIAWDLQELRLLRFTKETCLVQSHCTGLLFGR